MPDEDVLVCTCDGRDDFIFFPLPFMGLTFEGEGSSIETSSTGLQLGQ